MRTTPIPYRACFFVLLTALTAEPALAVEEARLDAVAAQGRHVMPFDLEKTVHIFTPLDDGGEQRVVVKDPVDQSQIRLIREHLAHIAEAFGRGDFTGPARIHGTDMPGLASLQAAAPGQIEYRYRELPDGAAIDYLSRDAGLIAAVHDYFAAQLTDHARHAMAGHAGPGPHRSPSP